MAIIQPFNLEPIFMVDAAGTPEIFSFFALILVGIAMAKYDLPNKLALTFFALFGIVMATYMPGLYVLICIIIGLTTFYSVARMIK